VSLVFKEGKKRAKFVIAIDRLVWAASGKKASADEPATEGSGGARSYSEEKEEKFKNGKVAELKRDLCIVDKCQARAGKWNGWGKE